MLTKLFERVYIPGQAGQTASPAYTVCSPRDRPGTWTTICTRLPTPAPNTGVQYPPGAYPVTVVDDFGRVVEIYWMVCAAQFVPAPGPIPGPVCVTHPARPFIQFIPARAESRMRLAWDAGANSIDEIDDNLSLRLTMGHVIGTVVGIALERGDSADKTRITHGFYFHSTPNGRPLFDIMERGKVISPEPTEYGTTDEFEVRRVAGVVTYWYGGRVVRTSRVLSEGAAVAATVVYASGDQV